MTAREVAELTVRLVAALAALVLSAVPARALACATCISGAYGDRSYGWAWLGLGAMPFAVVAGLGGYIAWRYRSAVHALPSGPGPAESPFPPKETT